MKRFFYTVLIWLIIHLHIYLLWSRFQQFVFQRKRLKIPKMSAVKDVMDIVREAKWTKDRWWQLWDAFSHPEHAYYNFINKGTLGDCDDFAAFTCHCVTQIGYQDVKVLSVQWFDYKGKFHGHNVALFRDDEGRLWMISNGFSNPLSMYDEYNAAAYWAKKYGGELIAYCTIRPDLKKILEHRIGK